MTLSAMYSFLLDRHVASDNDGKLTVDMLKVIMICDWLSY